MSRAQKALSVLVVACLGLWGCAKAQPMGTPAPNGCMPWSRRFPSWKMTFAPW